MFSLLKISYLLFFIPKNIVNYNKNRCITNVLFGKKKIDSKDNYIPKSDNQKEYQKSLYDNNIDLLFCLGPAGTGKTLFACKYGIKKLQENIIKKIIITRPTITIEENLGFLPGTINDKMSPFMNPIYDIFLESYTQKELTSFISNNIIEIVPLCYIQGRTFKNSIIIADEMQNSSPTQMFMLLTRIGNNSKMILTGDPSQTSNQNNGLSDIITKLKDSYDTENDLYNDNIKIIKMDDVDIQRHHIVAKINNLYQK